MKQYYYTDGKKKFGPFSFDEFKTQKISLNTLIWHDELENWIAAKEVNEVNDFILLSMPPPINNIFDSKEKTLPPPIDEVSKTKKENIKLSGKDIKKKEKSNKRKWIKIALYIVAALIFFILLIIVLNKSNKNSTSYPKSNYNSKSSNSKQKPIREKSEVELQKELGRREINNPLNYLTIRYKIENKIFSGKTKINIKIYSSAKMATYKDAVVRILYYTGTNTFISSEDYVIYKEIWTKSRIEQDIRVKAPDYTRKINVKLVSAKHYK